MLSSGYAFVASDSGQLVAFPAHRGVGGPADAGADRARAPRRRPRRAPAAARAGRAGRVETTDPVTGRDVVLFHAPVKPGGWSVVAVAPKAEIHAGIRRLRTTPILVGLWRC